MMKNDLSEDPVQHYHAATAMPAQLHSCSILSMTLSGYLPSLSLYKKKFVVLSW